MDTALPQKFPFISDRNLAKANCTRNTVQYKDYCDTVVLVTRKYWLHFTPPQGLANWRRKSSPSLPRKRRPPRPTPSSSPCRKRPSWPLRPGPSSALAERTLYIYIYIYIYIIFFFFEGLYF